MRVEFSKIAELKNHPKTLKTLGKAFFSPDALARKIVTSQTRTPKDVKSTTIIEFPTPVKTTELSTDDSVLDFSNIIDFGEFCLVDDSVSEVLNERDLTTSEDSESLASKALKFKDEQQIIYSAIMGRVYESASSGAEGGCGPCGGDGGTSAGGGKGSSEGKGSGHEHCKCGAEITSSGYCENGHKV